MPIDPITGDHKFSPKHEFPQPHFDEGCVKCGGFEGEPCEPPQPISLKMPQKVQTFDEWHLRHACTTAELWKMQNMLGFVLGWNHPLAVDASNAWKQSEHADNEV